MRDVQVMEGADWGIGNLLGNQDRAGGQHCGCGAVCATVGLGHSAGWRPVWAHRLRLHSCCCRPEDHQRVRPSSQQLWWGPWCCHHIKGVPALHTGAEAALIMTPRNCIAAAIVSASMEIPEALIVACRRIGRLEQLFALGVAVFGAALSLTGTIQAVSKIATGAV